jgi:hypothetical protein
MRRFRLLRFYVVGLVCAIALAVFAISSWRTATDMETPQDAEAAAVAPLTADP